jgi:hypothetical protein
MRREPQRRLASLELRGLEELALAFMLWVDGTPGAEACEGVFRHRGSLPVGFCRRCGTLALVLFCGAPTRMRWT